MQAGSWGLANVIKHGASVRGMEERDYIRGLPCPALTHVADSVAAHELVWPKLETPLMPG